MSYQNIWILTYKFCIKYKNKSEPYLMATAKVQPNIIKKPANWIIPEIKR